MVSDTLPAAVLKPKGSRKIDKVERHTPAREDAFVAALLEVPCEYKHRNPMEWVVSLVVHIVAILALIVAPLFFTQTLDLKAFQSTWLIAPAPPAPPPPPAAPVVQRTVRTVQRLMTGGKVMAPTVIPKKVEIIKEEPLPPDTGTDGVVGGVPGGIPGGQYGGVLGGIIGSTGSHAAVGPPPPPVKRIVRVGGDLKPPRQLFAPPPVYPTIAKQAGIQGTVVVDAVIDEQGNVVQAHVVSGPGLLLNAALQAVANWKYQPTRLNGEPISVEMRVEVHFLLQ
ncbi:MAG TPA: TonB family protein [Candidatus Acidoferrum sp.]|nr:TonB family protein [Candidatus Acidoferrum sp.]